MLRRTTGIIVEHALVAFLLIGICTAQDFDSASVSGAVVDSNQQPLDEVEVQLLDDKSGRILTTHTDLVGGYAFSGLSSGRYSLTFLHPEYAARSLPRFELLLGSPLEIPVKLDRLGPPLTRPRAGIETIALEYGMVREQISSVPMLLGAEGRTAIDKLSLLVPGLTPVAAQEIDPLTGRAAAVSANGSRPSAINYQLDGASNNAQNRLTGSQVGSFGPTPEALEVFRVVSHTYSAREGRNAGAIVSPLTRGGESSWHGQARAFLRPRQGDLETFGGGSDSIAARAGGGQIGGPLWKKRNLFMFVDAEGWAADRRSTRIADVLSAAERSGDLSTLESRPIDPTRRVPFPDGIIPQDRLDPLMQTYLDAFVPVANIGEDRYRSEQDLRSTGQILLGRIDYAFSNWTLNFSHLFHHNNVLSPLDEIAASPGTVSQQRQRSNNAQITLTQTVTPKFSHTTRISGQRLVTSRWQGHPDFRNTTADEFGFDYLSFGAEVGTIPDVTLWDDNGLERLRIAPFLSAEDSAQSTFQLRHDLELRHSWAVVRGGASLLRGIWPFQNTENFAGSFSFPSPPEAPIRARPDGLRDLLLGRPGEYRLQSPRDLNLRWRQLALYAETELRPIRSLQVTLGLRYERQPPGVDSQDRLAAFRRGAQTERFPSNRSLANVIYPGDIDGERGPLPRSTTYREGNQLAPRIGVAFSPPWDSRIARWIFGPPERSVIRASYGLFYDFGAFAGSSAAALFQATYPPFSSDNRYEALGGGAFGAPFGSVPRDADNQIINSNDVRYPLLSFDPDFENARAHHWNFGLQRLLPGGVFVSGVYVGTRSLALQRQRELNLFFRNALRPFVFIRSMRLLSSFDDIRQIESTGSGRYKSLQLRANRYLRRGLAFDVGYTWSQSHDDGSDVLGGGLVTEPWTFSNFDRRHNLTASWVYAVRPPRAWTDRMSWIDRWSVSGIWRWRSGLPLDIRQDEDPTFTFEQVGRPDLTGEFQQLDPSRMRTFTMADGREVTGHFAFDPTAFTPVRPTNFNQTRPGTLTRNPFRMRGFQQWDMRIARPVSVSEQVSLELGLDLMNIFGAKNWNAPFANIDNPFFGVVQSEGVGRTFQAAIKASF